MATQDIVCAGWVDSAGVKHLCGKHLGQKETLHPGVTHSMCAECLENHLAASGFTPEQTRELLLAAWQQT